MNELLVGFIMGLVAGGLFGVAFMAVLSMRNKDKGDNTK